SLLTYVPQYNDQKFTPADMPANVPWPRPSGTSPKPE
ncbi:MAG: hypothetical protein QOE48_3573, partial [Mycobacterium sp.]|nr:hypothetical protein [Mycobacterium sp.]